MADRNSPFKNPCLLGRLQTVLDKGFQLMAFELPSYWISIDHDLVLGIREGQGVVALDIAAEGFQFGTVVIGDIALNLTTRVIVSRSMTFDELLNPLFLFLDIFDRFLNAILILSLVVDRMLFHQQLDLLLKGIDFLAVLGKLCGVFLGGVRWELAAVQGKLLHPYKIQLCADPQDLHEHVFDVRSFGGDKRSDGGMVRLGFIRQCHEDDIVFTGSLDFAGRK